MQFVTVSHWQQVREKQSTGLRAQGISERTGTGLWFQLEGRSQERLLVWTVPGQQGGGQRGRRGTFQAETEHEHSRGVRERGPWQRCGQAGGTAQGLAGESKSRLGWEGGG